MNGDERDQSDRDSVGLCRRCRMKKLVRSARGSEFWLCERSRTEPARFPKYPRLPVRSCAGYAPPDP
jgi:hypothetical protein